MTSAPAVLGLIFATAVATAPGAAAEPDTCDPQTGVASVPGSGHRVHLMVLR